MRGFSYEVWLSRLACRDAAGLCMTKVNIKNAAARLAAKYPLSAGALANHGDGPLAAMIPGISSSRNVASLWGLMTSRLARNRGIDSSRLSTSNVTTTGSPDTNACTQSSLEPTCIDPT